jgi:error-prone DNA polymerase
LEATDDDARPAVRLGFRLVRQLANDEAAAIVAGRADHSFVNVDDVWRRSTAKISSLVRLAEADAFRPSLGLARREALWAIKALRDTPLPLFTAAADRDGRPAPEIKDEAVRLKAMTAGHEVVEDYSHVGLSLRPHPLSFLRSDLSRDKIVTCAAANAVRDGGRVKTAGLVLVRQKPGSAKGVMFITIEDETGVANLVIWPSLYEQQRRVILTANTMSVQGRVQREGDVVHIVADTLGDLSDQIASISQREGAFPLPHGRGDEFHHGGPGLDPRGLPPRGAKVRDIYVPDLHIETLKPKTRDFR